MITGQPAASELPAVSGCQGPDEALRKAGEKLYESIEITTLLDGDVTTTGLDKVFGEVGKKVRSQDVFVFFLAGHGKTVDGRYFFLPQDFRYDGKDSITIRGEARSVGRNGLPGYRRARAYRSTIPGESGSLTGARVAERGLERVAALDRMTRAMGRTVLTASTDDAPALEGFRGHGVFTYAVLDAFGRRTSMAMASSM